MHVTLRRSEFLMPSEFLNRLPGSTPHGEMATERVPKDVNPCRHVCPTCRVSVGDPRALQSSPRGFDDLSKTRLDQGAQRPSATKVM